MSPSSPTAVSSSVPCLSSVSFLFVLFHVSLICVVSPASVRRQPSTCAGVSHTHTYTRCVFCVTCVNAFVGLSLSDSQCVRASAYCCVCACARVCVHVRVQERACMRYRSVLRQRIGVCTHALCCVCACDVCSCVVPCMCQYLSLYIHRYWHLHGAEHGTSCRLKFAKHHRNSFLPVMMCASWRKRAPSWKDRKCQLWNRRRARNRPVRYDAKRSEHRVPELNRERKKGNTLNCHR